MESLVAFPPKTIELQNVKGGGSIKNVDFRVQLSPVLNGCIFVGVWPKGKAEEFYITI